MASRRSQDQASHSRSAGRIDLMLASERAEREDVKRMSPKERFELALDLSTFVSSIADTANRRR